MHTSMMRLRSRAPRGERAYGKVPRNRGKNLTLIASMSLSGMGEAMCGEGAHRSERSPGAFPALLLAGFESHIEEAFSKIKGIVRKLGARTHEALSEAIANALSAITPQDAAGWFNHCGYEVEVQYL